jgi:hypothetical protein
MIWRRLNGIELGADPPPLRPLYLRPQHLIVHLRWRVVETIAPVGGGSPTVLDSGWGTWVTLDDFYWPQASVAQRGGSAIRSTVIYLQTGGRKMPWQIINERTLRTTVLFTTTTTTSLETIDVDPGEEQVFNYSTTGNSTLQITRSMVLVPAEGV